MSNPSVTSDSNVTSGTNLKCPVPQCTYETGSASEIVAVALLTAHTTVHSNARPSHHGPKLDRPHIDVGVSAEEWKLFESRWKLYAQSSNINPGDSATQLFQCASEQLGDAILRIDNDVSAKSEQELLNTMKSLAVIPVATMVIRAELFAMRQNREETFRSFFAIVRGKAETCSYSTRQSCKCGTTNVVDFTEIIVRDVVIAGINDDEIRRRVMSVKDLCDKSANDIVSLVEAEEMARDSIPQVSNTAAFSNVKQSKTAAEPKRKPPDAQRTIPCPQCNKDFHPCKKGRYGWNKKPHTMCMDCFRAQKSSSSNSSEKASSNSLSLSQVAAVSSLSSPLCATIEDKNLRHPCQVAPVHLSHHIFKKGQWKKLSL